MARSILLTSLDAMGTDRDLHYYSAQNEFDFDYCEAMQSTEASAKYILSRFPIDEILVIGEETSPNAGDEGKSFLLKDARALYSEKSEDLSAFDLYRSRLAQHMDELSLEQQAYGELLPEEDCEKLRAFIRDFQERYSKKETKRLNRFFDELACSKELYEQFTDALSDAFPGNREKFRLTLKWVKNELYTQLKPSARLEILPVNENTRVRYIPDGLLEKREYWYGSILDIDPDGPNAADEIHLYVSLSSNSPVDDHLVMNILNILISTPGSNIRLKKIYRVSEASASLTGKIEDNTVVSRSTDLVAAAHAFLQYSKTDMLVNFWENSGAQDARISRLIYAARHVDVGMSMCNILEVHQGIELLKNLFKDEHSWSEHGEYGLLFGLISGCIQADYGPLLQDDGEISFIELIKWAYRHQLYQQTLTLIETYAPTYLVNSGIFYYCDDEARAKDITRLLALQRLELKPYEYYKMDDIDHYFIKNYDRVSVRGGGPKGEDKNLAYAAVRAQSIENRDAEKISGCTACDSIETVQNVLYAYYYLGTMRNKISHADYEAMTDHRLMVSEDDVSSAMILMKESIEYFILTYEKAMEQVKGKNPKIVAISPDEVRRTAEGLRREKGR